MYTVLIVLDVLLAVTLIVLIMLQQGKGADAGAAFGSGGSGTVFGAAGGASVLTKITTWLAIGFFAVNLGLAVVAKDRVKDAVTPQKRSSVVQEDQAAPQVPDQESPLTPVEAPVDLTSEQAIPEEQVSSMDQAEVPDATMVPGAPAAIPEEAVPEAAQ